MYISRRPPQFPASTLQLIQSVTPHSLRGLSHACFSANTTRAVTLYRGSGTLLLTKRGWQFPGLTAGPWLSTQETICGPRSLRAFATTDAQALPSLPTSIFNPKLFKDTLSHWFEGAPVDATAASPDALKRWYGTGDAASKEAFDEACRKIAMPALNALGPEAFRLPEFVDFETDRRNAEGLSKAIRDVLTQAEEGGMTLADATLALVIILDQMPRNCHRDLKGQQLVYGHYDRLSRAIMHYAFDEKHKDEPFYKIDEAKGVGHSPLRRTWFWMPLEHCEDLEDHDLFESRAQDLRQTLLARDDKDGLTYLDQMMEFEKQHRAILERFGRYPHRNEALGREMTAEEQEWLHKGGATFGTTSRKEPAA